MDTVILAAGRGARLEGVAAPFWKPLTVVDGIPLLVSLVQAAAVNDGPVIVVASPENVLPICQVLGSNNLDSAIDVVVQPTPAGPGDAFLRAASLLHDPTMVLAADNVISEEDMLRCHGDRFVIGTRLIRKQREAERFTLVNEDGHVTEDENVLPMKWNDGMWRAWLGPIVVDPRELAYAINHVNWSGEAKIGKALDIVGSPTLVEVDVRDVGSPVNWHHREVFFAYNGPGPFTCFDCGKDVVMEEVHVHHRDNDKTNNEPNNLAAAHPDCHSRFTNLGRKERPEVVKRRVDAIRGRPLSEEHKAKLRGPKPDASGKRSASAKEGWKKRTDIGVPE